LITPTRLIVSDLNRTFDIHDSNGRNLKVRRITALDRLRLLKAAGPELSQNDAWLNMAALVMSVVEVNGTPRPTPMNERQIEVAIVELGDQGLEAIAEALDESNTAALLFDGPPEGNFVGTPI
jgi:redox-sensitive bicupin YhaK (pirin superfamily)